MVAELKIKHTVVIISKYDALNALDWVSMCVNSCSGSRHARIRCDGVGISHPSKVANNKSSGPRLTGLPLTQFGSSEDCLALLQILVRLCCTKRKPLYYPYTPSYSQDQIVDFITLLVS